MYSQCCNHCLKTFDVYLIFYFYFKEALFDSEILLIRKNKALAVTDFKNLLKHFVSE